jgi:hypothetical protein
MKTLIVSIVIFLGIVIIYPVSASAQGCCQGGKASCHKNGPSTVQTNPDNNVAKDSLKVSGMCEMCKARIETAAKSVKGVNYAFWNETSGMLAYSFDGSVKKEEVSNALLKVGHDTELGKAPDAVYNKLPACCKYRK